MNTIHDIGGLDGQTLPERDQGRILKEDWERLIWGLVMAVWSKRIPGYGGGSRADIERIPPQKYLNMPYYAKWLWAEEVAVVRSGLVSRGELENPHGALSMPEVGNFSPATAADVTAYLTGDDSFEIPAEVPPLFAVGDHVIVRNEHPSGHTRMPRYLRGHRGVVYSHHGVHGFQDDVAEDVGQQHLYTVRFTGPELWGSRAHPKDVIHAELWDYHLLPADD